MLFYQQWGANSSNLSMELENKKILSKYNVKLIGASKRVIQKAEDRRVVQTINENWP